MRLSLFLFHVVTRTHGAVIDSFQLVAISVHQERSLVLTISHRTKGKLDRKAAKSGTTHITHNRYNQGTNTTITHHGGKVTNRTNVGDDRPRKKRRILADESDSYKSAEEDSDEEGDGSVEDFEGSEDSEHVGSVESSEGFGDSEQSVKLPALGSVPK